MENLLMGYIYDFSQSRMREWLSTEAAQVPGRAGVPFQQQIPPQIARESSTLAKNLAAALVLAGLRPGDAVTVNGRYYALISSPDITLPPEERAKRADLMLQGYLLGQQTETPGNEPETFLKDYPALVRSFATVAGHRIVADRYPSSVYLKFLSTAVRATENEVTTMLTRVTIPVFVVTAVKVLMGVVISSTSPVGWVATGVLAAAGMAGLVGTIRSGITNIRKARSYSMQIDRSLGPDRAKVVAFLLDESKRLQAVHDTASSEKRLTTFVKGTIAKLTFDHTSTMKPEIDLQGKGQGVA